MRCVAFAVLLVSLGIGGRVSASNTGKASLVRRSVPRSQLGLEETNASTCPNGNSTRGPCGAGVPAGITYATTARNWSQALSTALTGCPTGVSCATQTVTLAAGAVGVDTTSGLYQVHIADGSKNEAVYVKGGSYPPTGATSGTITFVPYFSHTSYKIESASSGIQETINAACGTSATWGNNGECNVTIPAVGGPDNLSGPTSDHPLYNYRIYGTIFVHANHAVLSGYGASLNCLGRGPCLQLGDWSNANHFYDITVKGLHFRAPVVSTGDPAYAGSAITNTVVSSSVATITTSSAHNLRPGDVVAQLFTDSSSYWGDAVVSTVPTSTTFTSSHPKDGGSIASQATPGVVALAYGAVLDNANSSHFIDVSMAGGYNESRKFNNFFDIWDDENTTIEHFDNGAVSLNGNANWSGSFVFSGGAANTRDPSQQFAPVITVRDSSITANTSNCITDYNSNGLYFENSVCQATGLWQVYASNVRGNYQGAYLKNIYTESTLSQNPASGATSPFPGLGIAGLIAGADRGSFSVTTGGSTGLTGAFPTGGSGSRKYSYYIVANDTTAGTHTNPMQVLNWNSTGSDSIPVSWPRVASGTDIITYDVIRVTTPGGAGTVTPYNGGCTGGSGGTCGSVATALSQATACSGGLVCTYTDTGSSSTSLYVINGGTYSQNLNFWPGTLVSQGNAVLTDREIAPVVTVESSYNNRVQIAGTCSGNGVVSPGGYTVCTDSLATWPNQTATFLADFATSAGPQTLTKGRLNFSGPTGAFVSSHHIITLLDSQPGLTQATVGYRPPASASDTWIGTDIGRSQSATSGKLAFGAPVAITQYINNTGDGSSWLERLTSKQKTFAVPVRITRGNSFTLGDGSPLSQMQIYSVDDIPASHVPPQSCMDVVGQAVGLTKSDQITGITPPAKLGSLSLNAYAAGADKIMLHFCNASGSEGITPPGAYSFLAVH